MVESVKVSVIIIFLNGEQFIEEAIESVLAQTYQDWELILVNDGSTDASTEIAKYFAEQYPEQVLYFEHPARANRGKGTSRNLGIQNSRGEYVAFLDADDVWMPAKLAEQVEILKAYPEAKVLYGNTLYWYGWTKSSQDEERDFIPPLGINSNTVVEPPSLLARFLRGKAAVPCTCSIILSRDLALKVGGFEAEFIGVNNIYEDQAFYAKICLEAAVCVADQCWDKYRQHPDASMAAARSTGQEYLARRFYLNWLADYLNKQGIVDQDLWIALRKELWRNRHYHYPQPSRRSGRFDAFVGWVKKWILRLEELAIPSSFSVWFWCRR
jgi:glycosyltransferase involved in cell wall biosynthesis